MVALDSGVAQAAPLWATRATCAIHFKALYAHSNAFQIMAYVSRLHDANMVAAKDFTLSAKNLPRERISNSFHIPQALQPKGRKWRCHPEQVIANTACKHWQLKGKIRFQMCCEPSSNLVMLWRLSQMCCRAMRIAADVVRKQVRCAFSSIRWHLLQCPQTSLELTEHTRTRSMS